MQNKYENIRPATSQDLDSVYSILSQCALTLSKDGYNHWSELNSYEVVKKHFETHDVYVLEVTNDVANKATEKVSENAQKEIVATISVSAKAPEYYEPEYNKFFSLGTLGGEKRAIYLSRLGVSPSHRRNGYGKIMIRFCEELAKENGYRYIRFDARGDIESLVKFYDDLGYTNLGTVLEDDEKYNVYEKSIQ